MLLLNVMSKKGGWKQNKLIYYRLSRQICMKWWQSALDKVLCPDLIHLMDTIDKLYVAHASVPWAVFTLSLQDALSDVRQERSTALASPSSALFWKLVNERLNASTWQLLPSYECFHLFPSDTLRLYWDIFWYSRSMKAWEFWVDLAHFLGKGCHLKIIHVGVGPTYSMLTCFFL